VSETKRKQRPKKGRVVRITPDLVTIISEEQREGETIPETIRRLLGLSGEVRYVLPSDIHETVEDARGAAVIRAVRSRIKRAERPIPVRVKP
jgi:hypothetical protein